VDLHQPIWNDKSLIDASHLVPKLAGMNTRRTQTTSVCPFACNWLRHSIAHLFQPRNCAIGISLLLAGFTCGQELLVTPEAAQGIYQPGAPIRWNVEVKGAAITEATVTLKKGGLTEFAKDQISLSAGKGQIKISATEPGWILAEVTVAGTNNQPVKALGGALVSPEKINPAQERPQDFDQFWQAKLKQLEAVPANPKLERQEAGKPELDYFKISMDNIWGTRINGQLARPKTGEKLPAMLIVQWAGVYPLQKSWATDRAAEGWLVLNIIAHDLPISEPESFYQEQSSGPLKDYPAIGNDDRETSYFLRMYLSCYRGAQFLTERPDWDGRTLVVTGGSQGGLQSLVTAAIHPRISGVMACVPAGCDLNGPAAGRLPGWPMWYNQTNGKDENKVRSAARYYDVVNFASRIKCPVLIGVGLIDTVCPPPGVFAAFNLIQGPKEIVVLPVAEHGEKNHSHAPYYARVGAWSKALLKGDAAPVNR
jgi:cephalosporin-C deacetylase